MKKFAGISCRKYFATKFPNISC